MGEFTEALKARRGDGGGNSTPPPRAGDGGGNSTPPPEWWNRKRRGDGGGNSTPPPKAGDGGGNSTPPPRAGDGGGNSTPPPEWWNRKRRGDGGGNSTPPPRAGDGGGNSTPPPRAGDGGGNSTPPPEWWNRKRRGDGGGNSTPPPMAGDGGGNSTPPPLGRALHDINVQYISLVPAAANMRQFIAKNARDEDEVLIERMILIEKSDEDSRLLYGIVYAPNELDTQGDMATPEEIVAAAYRFMKNGPVGAVDAFHDTIGREAYVAESWIVKAGDPVFPEPENEGAWAVGIVVEDDDLWGMVKDGTLTGLSMMGSALADPLPIEKGEFGNQLASNMGYEITGALRDAVRAVLANTKIADKTPALNAVWTEFLGFLSGVFSGATVAPAVVQAAAPVAKDDDRVAELAERLDMLEKQTVGRTGRRMVGDEAPRVRGLKLL